MDWMASVNFLIWSDLMMEPDLISKARREEPRSKRRSSSRPAWVRKK